nr:interleukin-15 [Columba livia]
MEVAEQKGPFCFCWASATPKSGVVIPCSEGTSRKNYSSRTSFHPRCLYCITVSRDPTWPGVPHCTFLIQILASVLSNVPAGRMLGTAWPPQNSAEALSRLESQKTHLKSICLQYQLYLLLNSHFSCLLKNEMRLIIFFLCAYLPKTAAGHCKWAEVLKDLEQIKTSKDIDVSLYTANTDEDKECQEPIMRCFFLEMKVIVQECYIKNCSKTQDVLNIWKNGNASLENNKSNSTTSAKCKECEEYEEKNFTEFIQSFVKVIQRECRH